MKIFIAVLCVGSKTFYNIMENLTKIHFNPCNLLTDIYLQIKPCLEDFLSLYFIEITLWALMMKIFYYLDVFVL